ncbi:MAG: 1,4-dihydroxy-2-naphthoate polyprenyltransferase [Lentisphaerae bacterium]|nr:1,4-dihydroxy-2-naphthoate polyprenyltransferase [Lentisphaerota bacterium]
MPSLKTWIMASRPKTLPAAVAPVMIGTAMAAADGHCSGLIAAATLLAALFIQIGTNFANDYFDFVHGTDTPDRKGPTRVTQAGLVSLGGMRWATAFSFGVAAAFGLLLIYHGGWPILLIGVLSIIAGVFYTAGPHPLGYIGLGDILVLIFFGFAAVGGTYYVQTGTINTVVLIAAVGPGLLSTAILAVNNLRDRTTDIKTGKRTLAVRFGSRFARGEYLFTIVVTACVPIVLCLLTRAHYLSLLSIATLLLTIPSIKTVFGSEGGPALNHVLGATGRVLFLYSLAFTIGWLL